VLAADEQDDALFWATHQILDTIAAMVSGSEHPLPDRSAHEG